MMKEVIIMRRRREKREKKETNGKNKEASKRDIRQKDIMKFIN